MLLKSAVLVVSLFISTLSLAGNGDFPMGPDPKLTPGSLCQHPTEYRYPEKIKYCERNVSTGEKRGIYERYDHLGYHTRQIRNGTNFKIDHYIPLCAGGSNDQSNLWPQHESIYTLTDKLEELVCIKMSEGHLSQKGAIEYIVQAKNHLETVNQVMAEVNAL